MPAGYCFKETLLNQECVAVFFYQNNLPQMVMCVLSRPDKINNVSRGQADACQYGGLNNGWAREHHQRREIAIAENFARNEIINLMFKVCPIFSAIPQPCLSSQLKAEQDTASISKGRLITLDHMAVKTSIEFTEGIYFIAFTCFFKAQEARLQAKPHSCANAGLTL